MKKSIIFFVLLVTTISCIKNVNLKKDATQEDIILIGRWLRFEGDSTINQKESWIRYRVLASTICNGIFDSSISKKIFALDPNTGFFAIRIPKKNIGKNETFKEIQLHCVNIVGQIQQHQVKKIIDTNIIPQASGVFVLPARKMIFNNWEGLIPLDISIIENGQHDETIEIFKKRFPSYSNFNIIPLPDDGFKK